MESPKPKLIDEKKKYHGWTIDRKLDEGGFGQVYRVTKKGQIAALKAESNAVEGGSAIKLEMLILQQLNSRVEDDKAVPHVVKLYHSAKRQRFCYMIITLLGKNMRTLKNWKKGVEVLTTATWCRLGLQCLYGIKLVHDIGFVHRDIKPANLMMGCDNDVERARLIHILDFGLARSYAFQNEPGGGFIARRARASVEFRGTIRYCSPNVHLRLEQGRQDDLYALIYLMVELNCGLPWQATRDKDILEKLKLGSTDKIGRLLPSELSPIVPHLAELNCYNRPDYEMIAGCFIKLAERLKVSFASPYDWEMADKNQRNFGERILSLRGRTPEYEADLDFWKLDPVKVNEAPPKEVNNMSDVERKPRYPKKESSSIVASKEVGKVSQVQRKKTTPDPVSPASITDDKKEVVTEPKDNDEDPKQSTKKDAVVERVRSVATPKSAQKRKDKKVPEPVSPATDDKNSNATPTDPENEGPES